MTKLKRISAILLAAAFVVSTLAFSVSAEGEPTASVAYGTPEAIDGVLDDKWAGSVKVDDVFRAIESAAAAVHEVTQVRASMRTMWDEGNLYFFFDVADPTVGTVEQENEGALWQRNTIQFFMDWGHEGHSTNAGGGYDSNDCGFQLNVGGRSESFNNAAFAGSWDFATVVNDAGYTMEVAIDFSKFSSAYEFVPAAGKEIGFGFIVCDSDESYTWHRDSFCGWGVSALMQDYPNQMGVLALAAKPGYPTATAAYGTPGAVDGAYDSGWRNSVKVDDNVRDVNQEAVDYHISQGWAPVTQVRSGARFMWDENNFYILVEVADPTVGSLEEESTGNPWLRNVVQIGVDLGYERDANGYDANDFGFEIGARGTVRQFANNSFADCYTYATTVTEAGYVVEIAIDYSKIGAVYEFDPEAGKQIGVGIIVCDSDTWYTWHRDSVCIWGVSELLNTYPNQFGVVTFGFKENASSEASLPSVIASISDAAGDDKIDHLYLNAAISASETREVGIIFSDTEASCEAGAKPLFIRVAEEGHGKSAIGFIQSGCYGSHVITAANLGGEEGDSVIAVYWQEMPTGTLYARTFAKNSDGTYDYGAIATIVLEDGASVLPIK